MGIKQALRENIYVGVISALTGLAIGAGIDSVVRRADIEIADINRDGISDAIVRIGNEEIIIFGKKPDGFRIVKRQYENSREYFYSSDGGNKYRLQGPHLVPVKP